MGIPDVILFMQMKKNSYNDCLFLLHIAISKICSESGSLYALGDKLNL